MLAVVVLTNAGAVESADEGMTNTPLCPPLLLDIGVAL
jgi:hypothetical protein